MKSDNIGVPLLPSLIFTDEPSILDSNDVKDVDNEYGYVVYNPVTDKYLYHYFEQLNSILNSLKHDWGNKISYVYTLLLPELITFLEDDIDYEVLNIIPVTAFHVKNNVPSFSNLGFRLLLDHQHTHVVYSPHASTRKRYR
jgi:hypothetical protein